MVVVDLLENIIAEERQLEEELRRLSLSAIKPLVVEEESPGKDINVPTKLTYRSTLDKTRTNLERLRVINSIHDSYTSIRKDALGMVVEVFTLYELVHRRMVVFHDEHVNRHFYERSLCRGEHVHINGSTAMEFFTRVRSACVDIKCKHIHYSVSPNTDIANEVELAWGIMSLVPMLSELSITPPDLLILTSDKFSGKYLEYLRKQLPESLLAIRRMGVTIMSNISVVQLCASFQISVTNS